MRKNFVYLASASPRRRELLGQIGVEFEARVPDADESLRPGEAPADYVRRLAEAKADVVWRSLGGADEPAPVVGADTAVVLDERVLGKPDGVDAALGMLETLSGRTHRVYTGVAVRHRGGLDSLVNVSEVRFRPTTDAERRAYCGTGEPFDKAGGYGIQGLGAVFVEHLSGSYSAVMGLPLCETALLLERVGVPAWLVGA
ncbi:MAG: septum formation inhibitor Maf [Gammaproteobacteria bacterium]|nr:septum formation inhibitor Maf [Gammaproteobacteria bacterium]